MASQSANKKTIERIANEVFNAGKIEVLDEVLTPDFHDHSIAHAQMWGIAPTREGYKQLVEMLLSGVSDFNNTIEELIADGNMLAGRVRATGRHTGNFMGAPPTGKRIDLVDFHFWRFKHGKIREHWNQDNAFDIMQQLGVIPKQ